MADPSILIDAESRVVFSRMWTHVPALKRAIDALLAQGWRGTVLGGIDRRPHLLPSISMAIAAPAEAEDVACSNTTSVPWAPEASAS